MGNKDSKSGSSISDWQKFDTDNGVQIWKNIKNKQLAQRRAVTIDPHYDINDELKIYHMRQHNRDSLVRAFATQTIDKKKGSDGLCSSTKKINVLTEKMPYRLSDMPQLTFPESLLFLRESLRGYHKVYKSYGPIHVTPQLIGVNNFGQVKCWVNENWAMNHPTHELPTLQTTKLKDVSKQDYMAYGAKYRDETEMVHNIGAVIQEKCEQGKFPEAFSEQVQFHSTTFKKLQLYLQDFINYNKIFVPPKINYETVFVTKYETRLEEQHRLGQQESQSHGQNQQNIQHQQQNNQSHLVHNEQQQSNNQYQSQQPSSYKQTIIKQTVTGGRTQTNIQGGNAYNQQMNYSQSGVNKFNSQPNSYTATKTNYQGGSGVNHQQNTSNNYNAVESSYRPLVNENRQTTTTTTHYYNQSGSGVGGQQSSNLYGGTSSTFHNTGYSANKGSSVGNFTTPVTGGHASTSQYNTSNNYGYGQSNLHFGDPQNLQEFKEFSKDSKLIDGLSGELIGGNVSGNISGGGYNNSNTVGGINNTTTSVSSYSTGGSNNNDFYNTSNGNKYQTIYGNNNTNNYSSSLNNNNYSSGTSYTGGSTALSGSASNNNNYGLTSYTANDYSSKIGTGTGGYGGTYNNQSSYGTGGGIGGGYETTTTTYKQYKSSNNYNNEPTYGGTTTNGLATYSFDGGNGGKDYSSGISSNYTNGGGYTGGGYSNTLTKYESGSSGSGVGNHSSSYTSNYGGTGTGTGGVSDGKYAEAFNSLLSPTLVNEGHSQGNDGNTSYTVTTTEKRYSNSNVGGGESNIQKSSFVSGSNADSRDDQILEGLAKMVDRPSNEIGSSGISVNRA